MAINLRTPEQKANYWKRFDRNRWQFLRWGIVVMNNALKEQVKPFADNPDGDINTLISKEPIERAFSTIYSRVGSHFAESTVEGMKAKNDNWERRINEWIALNGANRMNGITQTTINRLRSVLQRGIEEGMSIDDIAVRLAADNPAVNVRRATVIARTEIISASNLGSLEGARSTGLPLKKEWISTFDQRTREDHVFANGQTTETIDDPFNVAGESLLYPGDPTGSAGNVINCFTGDTMVSFDSCKKSIRSLYSGELVTIKTARGYKLTGTPNHPILTDRGFIRLDQVNHSTNLICCPLDRNITSNFNVDNIPISFKKLHNSFSVIGMRMRMSAINVNLYSRIPDSKVDIINIDGFLWNNFKSFTLKFFSKQILQITYLTQGIFFGFCLFNRLFNMKFFRHISHSLISSFNLLRSFFIRHFRPFQIFGFASASDMNTIFNKPFSNNVSTYSESFRNSVFTHTGLVERDNSININIQAPISHSNTPIDKAFINKRFTAIKNNSDFPATLSRFVEVDNPVFIESNFLHNEPVFTLETNEGIYNSGGIIARNCRCAQAYITY